MIKSYLEKRDNGNYSNTMFVTELAAVSLVAYYALKLILTYLI